MILSHYETMLKRLCLFICLATALVGCHRTPKLPNFLGSDTPFPIDSLPEETLRAGIRAQIQILQKRPEGAILELGKEKVTVRRYVNTLTSLLSSRNHEELLRLIFEDFKLISASGTTTKEGILVTGYFAPTIKGSLRRTKNHSQAIYALPQDLLTIDAGKFPGSPRFASYPLWSIVW